ncbi:MAG: glycoside hydrolase family 20 protein [Chitinophagaceae bacterium]
MHCLFRNILFFFGLLLLCSLTAPAQDIKLLPLIPAPVQWETSPGRFLLGKDTRIAIQHDSLQSAAILLQQYLDELQNSSKSAVAGPNTIIHLRINKTLDNSPEAYFLKIGERELIIEARELRGLGWGIQSLRQLWQPASDGYWLPALEIQDEPRFAYRGMALDVSRHFFPVSFIRQYIDLLALYRFNTFHWHLTDDQGWRIEIKSLPRLQEVAAWRSGTLIGHKKELPHRFDGKRYGGYYTQDEIKDIVAYAQLRGITVIPEIEMPGHALAALAAYPQLGCTGGPYETARFWGIFDDVFCAGNDSVFIFLQQVLDEVMALFPSPYIHIGGDECVKDKWKACSRCRQRMQKEGLRDEEELQSYFIKRIERFVRSRGRHIMGWDEILEGGLPPDALVMSWRGEAGGMAAAAQGHPVIMTPETHLYFDYYQSLDIAEPLASGGFNPLYKVYSYDPLARMDSAGGRWVSGVEGQAWSEYYYTQQQAWYMLYPRMLALAEVGWTIPARKNYATFLQRVSTQLNLLAAKGIYGNARFETIRLSNAAAAGGRSVLLESEWPGARIHYTLDGSRPTLKSPLYTQPIHLTATATIRAGLWPPLADTAMSFLSKEIRIHKASDATLRLVNPAIARFNTDPDALVNGLTGSTRYNDQQWLGFAGKDLDVLIELKKTEQINRVSTQLLRYHWQRMWEPVLLEIWTSRDGKKFDRVYRQDQFPVNGVNAVKAVFSKRAARFIRIRAKNKGIIPAGEYGQGNAALLLINEVTVE